MEMITVEDNYCPPGDGYDYGHSEDTYAAGYEDGFEDGRATARARLAAGEEI
jgi:hypothetical protein